MRERRIEDYYIGQEVWSIVHGKGVVHEIHKNNKTYQIECKFANIGAYVLFTISGKLELTNPAPLLFFEEVPIPESANIPKKWTPKCGEHYYSICKSGGELRIYREENTGYKADKNGISQGNCFKTEIEALAKLNKILEILKGE